MKFEISEKRVASIRLLPCMINKQAQPVIQRHDEGGEQVFNYLREVTEGAGLNAKYDWRGDEIEVGL